MDGVAVAALAARPAGDVPGIGSTAVAVLTDDVGLAGTLSGVLIALTPVRGGTGPRYGALGGTHALCREEEERYMLHHNYYKYFPTNMTRLVFVI